MKNETSNLADTAKGFYITDFCKCKCGDEVSPSQADTINQILYDNNRDKIVGFECWKCGEWIAFPKTCL